VLIQLFKGIHILQDPARLKQILHLELLGVSA